MAVAVAASDEINVWNPLLSAMADVVAGPVFDHLVSEVDMCRAALTCHFSSDVLCSEMHQPRVFLPQVLSVDVLILVNEVKNACGIPEPATLVVGGNFWGRIQKFGGLGDGWDGAIVIASAYVCFWKNLQSFVLAQFALVIWCIISVVLVSGSLCSGRLGVAEEFGKFDFSGDVSFYGCNAWFDSGYILCVSALVASEVFRTFSTLRRTRILERGKEHSQNKCPSPSFFPHKRHGTSSFLALPRRNPCQTPPHKMALNNILSRSLRWVELSSCKEPLRSANSTPRRPFRSESLEKNLKMPSLQDSSSKMLNGTGHHAQRRERNPNPPLFSEDAQAHAPEHTER